MVVICFLVFVAEEFFTSRSLIDVKELKENYPESALLLDVNDEELPDVSDLSYKSVPVHHIEVGSYVLVGTGEVCDIQVIYLSIWKCSNLVALALLS